LIIGCGHAPMGTSLRGSASVGLCTSDAAPDAIRTKKADTEINRFITCFLLSFLARALGD
jgi:hypothetical protein